METLTCSVCSTRKGEPIVLCDSCAYEDSICLYCHHCHSRLRLTPEQARELFTRSNEIRPGISLRFESDCLVCRPVQMSHYRVFFIEGQLATILPIEA